MMPPENAPPPLHQAAKGYKHAVVVFIVSMVVLACAVGVNSYLIAGQETRLHTIETKPNPCQIAPRGHICRESLVDAVRALERSDACVIVKKAGLRAPNCDRVLRQLRKVAARHSSSHSSGPAPRAGPSGRGPSTAGSPSTPPAHAPSAPGGAGGTGGAGGSGGQGGSGVSLPSLPQLPSVPCVPTPLTKC